MAPPKDAFGDVAYKKNKGLKNHKKAQKEKALARRIAATGKFYANNAPYASVTTIISKENAPVQEDVARKAVTTSTVKAIADVVVASELSRDEPTMQDKATTDVEALTVTRTANIKAITSQSQADTDPPVVAFEDLATGSNDNAPTKVGSSPTRVEQKFKCISYPKTAPPSQLKTAHIGMLNPTAPVFHFGKIAVAQTPPVEISITKEDIAPGWLTDHVVAFKKAYGVVALNKALEAALNENMETPRQRLIRCKYKVSVDAEFHPKEKVFDQAWLLSYLGKPSDNCFDDNGFEITLIKTGLTEADLTVSSALDELFVKVKAQGISKISFPKFDELAKFDGPVSIGDMSAISGTRVTKKPITPRTVEDVEDEMRLAATKRPPHAPAFGDPGILKYTLNGQDFDNVGNAITETVCQKVLGWLEDQPTSPPELSPGSSRQSREFSPLGPGQALTPLAFHPKPPSSGGQVWPIAENLPWCKPQDGYSYGSGIPVYPYVAFVVQVSDVLPSSHGEPE
ncbi:hypothetical protein BKA58DRAFT_471489 [Alternaria rosae]|uniref:uncharacterized protein n=1 Tax=Alternaria rosae TaxID=1187941 RepID=UPI001E8D9866|nr:uncharacterized protein BKA58DRAFT_471489 [Alternaria rosae]KAH6865518.1 hypothetical protein BKA58DRAFT_471489 [Alternaria rosae]